MTPALSLSDLVRLHSPFAPKALKSIAQANGLGITPTSKPSPEGAQRLDATLETEIPIQE